MRDCGQKKKDWCSYGSVLPLLVIICETRSLLRDKVLLRLSKVHKPFVSAADSFFMSCCLILSKCHFRIIYDLLWSGSPVFLVGWWEIISQIKINSTVARRYLFFWTGEKCLLENNRFMLLSLYMKKDWNDIMMSGIKGEFYTEKKKSRCQLKIFSTYSILHFLSCDICLLNMWCILSLWSACFPYRAMFSSG